MVKHAMWLKILPSLVHYFNMTGQKVGLDNTRLCRVMLVWVRYNCYRCGICQQFVCCLFPFLFYVFVMVVELWYDTATIVAAFADRLISVFALYFITSPIYRTSSYMDKRQRKFWLGYA